MTATPSTDAPTIVATGFFALDVIVDQQRDNPAIAQAGGTCGNVLAIMSHLGWQAVALSRMSGDTLSNYAIEDLRGAGVNMELASVRPCAPLTLIQQKNWMTAKGKASHRFFWSCPYCGKRSEPFRALTLGAATFALRKLNAPDVFFLDRVSPASAFLAEEFSRQGALVVFEPSGRLDPRLLKRILRCAAIVKYPPLYQQQMQLLMTEHRRSKCLEIKTQAEKGLSFRLMQDDHVSNWRHVPARAVDAFVDSSGAGDWCTAGIIADVGRNGTVGFDTATEDEILGSIHSGSILAATNCQYPGARGAMRAAQEQNKTSGKVPSSSQDIMRIARHHFSGCSPVCSPPPEYTHRAMEK